MALRQLPIVYAVALRLRDASVPEDQIAQWLDLEPAAVRPLLEVAEAKLVHVLHPEQADTERSARDEG